MTTTPQRHFDVAAFEKIVGAMGMPLTLRSQLLDAWLAARSINNGSRAEERCVRPVLLRAEWAWPWMDQWEDEFRRMRMRPATWDGYCGNRGSDQLEINGGRVVILLHTLAATAARLRDLDGWSRTDPGFKRRRYVLRPVGDNAGRAEAAIAKRFAKRITAGDLSEVPPYFPGDRTSLSFLTRADR